MRKIIINRNFALLWAGQSISQIGDKFYSIAVAWLILSRTNSPSSVGIFLALSLLPSLLLQSIAGVYVDRWNRKLILIMSDVIRAAAVLVLAVSEYVGTLEVWQVYTVVILNSLTGAFFDPAVKAVIPQLVEKEDIRKANSLSQATSGITTCIGPILGAMFVSHAGYTAVFLINGISFLIAAGLECFLEFEGIGMETADGSLLKDLREGISFVKNDRSIFIVIIIISIGHAFVGGFQVILPLLSKGMSGDGIRNLGIIETTIGLGLIAGSVYANIKKEGLRDRLLFIYMSSIGGCMFIISVLQGLRVLSVIYFVPALLIMGIVEVNAIIYWQSILQEKTPENMAGRIFSLSSMVGNISLPISMMCTGFILNSFSLNLTSFFYSLFLMILPVILMRIYSLKSSERLIREPGSEI